MIKAARLLDGARQVLAERSFSEIQINKVLPRLHKEQLEKPNLLAEIIDCWNDLLGNTMVPEAMYHSHYGTKKIDKIKSTAIPPVNSNLKKKNVDMNSILADIEPDLLLLDPEKLKQRHEKILGLGLSYNSAETWLILFNAPRGFYLQDWTELTKKIYYIDQKVIDLLHDKREKKEMRVHPIVRGAAVVESDFDHIRTRYLFAERSGYKELSHIYPIQSMSNRRTIKDLILTDDESYLAKFAPFCSLEEFSCFSNLIKNYKIDEEDAEIYQQLAELNALSYNQTSLKT